MNINKNSSGKSLYFLFLIFFLFCFINIIPIFSADLELFVSGFKVPDKEVLVSGKGVRISIEYLVKRTGVQKIFNSANNILALLHEGEVAQMQLDNPEAWFAQESQMFSCPPVKIDKRIFVEVAPVLDFLGCQYSFKAHTPVAEIISERILSQSQGLENSGVNNLETGTTGLSSLGNTSKDSDFNPGLETEKENKRSRVSSAIATATTDSRGYKTEPADTIETATGLAGLNPATLVEERDGVRYYHVNKYTPAGPLSIHLVAVNLNTGKYRFRSVLGKDTVLGRERTSRMGKAWKALAAINGAFYAKDGDPMGVVIDEKKLLSVPIFSRSVIGFTKDSKVLFGNPEFEGNIKLSDNRNISIKGLNQPSAKNEITIFTSEFGNSTHRYSKGTELVVMRGRVIGIGKHNSIIPPDGYVISADGTRASLFDGVGLWDDVKIDLSLSKGWSNVTAAVGGGPRLLKNGEIHVNGQEEKFSRSITYRRHPRSGIGVTANNWVIMAAIDGRQKKVSVGVTLKEFAALLKDFGCVDAINLDGGGSTTLVFGDKVVNSSSDQCERAVSSALVLCRAEDSAQMMARR